MRTVGFRSNILFAIAAGFGVIASLGRPWYARTPQPAPGTSIGALPSQMENFFSGIARALSEPSGITGWAALHTADHVIAGLAVATVLLLVLALVPSLERHVRDLARWTSLATVAVVLLKLVDEPGSNRLHEPRYGVLIALGCSAVLLACALTVAGAPSRKRTPVKTFVPPPPPPYQSGSSFGPPQF